MVWLATASAEVEKVATPPLSVPLPMELPPSRNVTVPVGVPVPGATAETVAVKVTDWPKTEGFTDDVTVVDVLALTIVRFAVAVLPIPAMVSLTVTLLLAAPTVTPCTSAETVHEAPGARLAPERLTEPDPALPDAVPVHVLLRPLGLATTRLLGSTSVKDMPLSV